MTRFINRARTAFNESYEPDNVPAWADVLFGCFIALVCLGAAI